MIDPNMQTVHIRVQVPRGTDVPKLLHGILMETEGMYDIVELKNNGFGLLVPDEDTRITFESLSG